MVDTIPLGAPLREKLYGQFHKIDVDGSGGISLVEFLSFVLEYKPFEEKLQESSVNEPYIGRFNLSS
jgi:hypothetical protein